MSHLNATHPPSARTEANSSVKPAFASVAQRRRVGEPEMARALADWFAGAPWSLEDAQWTRPGREAVHLRDQGDKLVLRGHVIATRNPAAVAEVGPGTNFEHFSDARAVARIALRGDHKRLYGLYGQRGAA